MVAKIGDTVPCLKHEGLTVQEIGLIGKDFSNCGLCVQLLPAAGQLKARLFLFSFSPWSCMSTVEFEFIVSG